MHNVRRIWTIALVVVLVLATAGCLKVRRKATFARTTSPVVYEEFVAVDDWSEWAAEIANHAAGIVVGKVGTVTVSKEELIESFNRGI